MIHLFIHLRFLDILDIFLVALIIYEFYMIIRGTAAFNIFVGIFIFYITWVLVKALNMDLLGNILGQFIGVGVLALIVVFQQEIRRAFLLLGSRYKLSAWFSFDKLLPRDNDLAISQRYLVAIVNACENLSKGRVGALIVLVNKAELKEYSDTGVKLNALISTPLIENIFAKNTPLHDGAIVVQGNIIKAARCILPLTDKRLQNGNLGLRHRAAIGMSQSTDALVIIVSEETGNISYAFEGRLVVNVEPSELALLIEEEFSRRYSMIPTLQQD